MLPRKNRIFFLLVLQFLFPITIFGQFKAASTERNTDLSFTTGVKVSWKGSEVFNEFKLVDDLGFEYNVMSVLKNEMIREELSISDEQYATMKSIQKKMTDELVPQAVAGISSTDIGKKLESQVKTTELILEDNLQPEQRVRLSQIKNQIRFERYGAAAIASSDLLEKELNVPAKLANQVREKVTSLKEEQTRRSSQLYEQANRKVIDSLPSKCKKKFFSLASEEFIGKVLVRPLFNEKPKKRFRRIPTDVSFLQLLSDKSVRDAIELVDSQYQDIVELKKEFDLKLEQQSNELLSGPGKDLSISQRGKQLAKLNAQNKREFEQKLRTFLLEHQLDRLVEISIEIEIKKAGTIQCLCCGTISERIELADDDAKKAYAKALEINEDLQVKVKRLQSDLNEQAMKLIPGFDVAKRLGNPVEYKLR